MRSRLDFHNILVEIAAEFDIPATRVYYQPPATIKMGYPCIVYTRDRNDTKFADGSPYILTRRYTVTVVDKNPDSEIPDRIALLPMSSSSRNFMNDNLYHFVYDVYY